MMSSDKSRFKCPICKRDVLEFNEDGTRNRYFPFCGDRCQVIDLGRWLDEKYVIPAVEEDEGEGE
jgi:uncharacterized protein